MLKSKKLLFFFSTFLLLICNPYGFAEETVTITTYYPSPYGVYNSLQTDKLGVGDFDGGGLSSADVPTTSGEAWIEGWVKSGDIDAVNDAQALWEANNEGGFSVGFNDGKSVTIGKTKEGDYGIGISHGVNPHASFYSAASVPVAVLQSYARDIEFITMKGNDSYMRLHINLSDGNIGIGTNDPQEKLEVNGNIKAADIQATGTVTANYIHATDTVHADSDARFKTNVIPLSGVLEKLERFRGVSFEWNALAGQRGHTEGEQSLGIVAQELEAVFPELVKSLGSEGYKAVDYSRLSAVLLEAVKELEKRVKELKEEQAALSVRLKKWETLQANGKGQL